MSGLAGGTYEFSLVVTDNTGLASAPDLVVVTINNLPLAAAGPTPAPATPTLQLSPNPTTDGRFAVLLALTYAGELSYTLLSATGAKVAEGNCQLPRSTSSLAFDFARELRQPGFYYLLLEGNGLRARVKVLRQ